MYHVGKLGADNRLCAELLAKDNTLVGPLEGLFKHMTASSNDTANNGPSLVIEIGPNKDNVNTCCITACVSIKCFNLHDNLETLSFLTQKVFNRDLNIFKGNVTSTSSNGVRGLDGLDLQAIRLLDQKHGNALLSANGDTEVVTEDS